MAQRIRILPEQEIGKISAGEVVDRPASVVKELVENSVDAGSTGINVEVESGGRTLIRVSDNGCGMEKEDALTCVRRHSTSKIEKASDIEHVGTLGFRGEALPSIAAVSLMELITRTEDAPAGTQMRIEGAKVKNVKETGCSAGTSISVQQLFFNTPARRKFLKTVSTEMAHIINILSSEALGRENISFSLMHNGKRVLNVPAGISLKERVLYLYGQDLKDCLIEFEKKDLGIRVYGLLGKPEHTRSQSQMLVYFVNGRPVRSKLLTHAVIEGYKPLLQSGRFPAVFMFVDIDPELIDVNIHPQKTEVKFNRSNQVHSMVMSLVKETLANDRSIRKALGTAGVTDRGDSVREAVEKYLSRGGGETRQQGLPLRQFHGAGKRPEPAKAEPVSARSEKLPAENHLLQVHLTYIIMQVKDGVLIVDQHAAHERILYERIRDEFERSRVVSQGLLTPFTLELGAEAASIVEDNLDLFASFGLEVENFGHNSFVLRSIPAQLKYIEPRRFFLDVADDLVAMEGVKEPARFEERMLTIMACRGAVKAGDKLKPDEMEGLIRNLDKTKSPHCCPHGRPTFVKFTLGELEKKFKRK